MNSRIMMAVCVLTLYAGAMAQVAPPTTRPASALGEVRRLADTADERVSVLENGLTVILKAHRTAPVVSVRMYCRTGSIYEQEYIGAGMSHLFEHLLHGSATSTRTEEQSRIILDELGGNTNAYTSFDVTCYFINTGKENAGRAIGLLGDWITDPTFPQEAFEREWGVVQRELERDVDDPERQSHYLLMETMFQVHPARHPIIGHKAVVQALTKDDIVGYYKRMYVPDNIVVAIAGDIDLDVTLGEVRQRFAGFQRRRMPTIVLPNEPEITTPRTASRPMKVSSAILQLAWPSIELTHPDLYALDVLSYVLTQGDSSLLARTVRDAGLTYSISSSSWTPHWARGMFVIDARLAPDKLEPARAAVLQQVTRVQNELIAPADLEKAKRQKAAEHVFASQTAEDVASMMAMDYIGTGDIHFSQAYTDSIQKVTAEQVREVAQRYLRPERLATISVVPEAAAATRPASGQVAGPQPVRKVVLENGLRCLIGVDHTTPLVAMQSFMLAGTLFETPKTNGLSQLAAYLAQRGTGTRSAADIAGFFDSRGGSLGATSGSNTVYFQAQVLADDFAPAFEVFADVVLNPSFPAGELDLYRPQILDAIERVDESWRNELMSYARRKFQPESPYGLHEIGSPDVIGKATREDVERFYRGQLAAGNMVVAIYGDVDPDKAEALVRKLFTGLPAGGPKIPVVAAAKAPERPQLFIKAKGSERMAAGICIGYPGMTMADRNERAVMAVLDSVVSGYRYPTGWLHEALRGGRQDFVYEVHAMNRPGLIPGTFQVYAACQPERVNEVYRIFRANLDKAVKGEFTPEEIERAKTIIVTSETTERQTNLERAMGEAIDELYGLGYDSQAKFIEAVRAAGPEDLRKMAERYFTTPIVAVVTPKPEAVDIGVKPVAIEGQAPAEAGR